MYKVVSYDKWNALPDIFMKFKEAKDAIKDMHHSYVIEDWTRGRGKIVWRKRRKKNWKKK